jgi:plastocyanin
MRNWGLLCLVGIAAVAAGAAPAAVVAHVQLDRPGSKGQTHVLATKPQTVVWLTPLDKQEMNPPEPQIFTMVQHDKMFSPHILVMPVGSTVSFPNKDPFFHNVFSFFNGRRFDLGLYQSGQSRSVTFNRVGVSYIFCDIHPEMSAVILTLDTPYFGTADERGDIRIPGAPAGSYTMQVWSEATSPEAMQLLTRRVVVSDTGITDLGVISIHVAPNIMSEHLNKFGEPYDAHTPPAY